MSNNLNKFSGWESEEVPDQLFAGKKGSGSFDSSKVDPISSDSMGLFFNKPSGGLWTADLKGDSSDWVDYLRDEMPEELPNEGSILRLNDPDKIKMYTIKDQDDYNRLWREYKDKNSDPMIKGFGPKKKLDWLRLFAPKDQGGGGLQLLRVTPEGLQTNYGSLEYWDIPSSVWSDPSFLEEIGKLPLSDTSGRIYRPENFEGRKITSSLIRVASILEDNGNYEESDIVINYLLNNLS